MVEIERRYAPETIGIIPVNNNQDKADVIRELSPQGDIVAHPRKHGNHVHERMFQRGTLDRDYFLAAEEFRRSFERAGFHGKFATIDFFRTRGAPNPEGSDALAVARENITQALKCFASQKGGNLSVIQSVVWFLIGCGETLEDFAWRLKSNGIPMSPDRASGMLVPACERLAIHYGIIRVEDVKDRVQVDAFQNGKSRGSAETVKRAKDIAALVAMKAKTPQEFLEEFNRQIDAMAQKRQERP